MKQDESDGDLKFTTTIGTGGSLASYWKSDRKQSWKWRGVYEAYTNPISNYDFGKMSFEKKERFVGHMLFIPQEVVWRDIWIRGFQRRHIYWWRSPWRNAIDYSSE